MLGRLRSIRVVVILGLMAISGGCMRPTESETRTSAAVAESAARPIALTSPQPDSGQREVGRFAAVNGLQMYYEVHGRGGTPLVLLHGGGSTIDTSFGRVLPSLAQTRQVIAFEQQGHGRTADLDRPFSFEQSADDAAALLDHLEVDEADFYGYSNGGQIALQIAIRHPERVRKLVVASAIVKRDGLDDAVWESLRTATPDSMPAELREAYLRVAPRPGDLATMSAKCAARMLALEDWDPALLRGIEAPTLVLAGDTHDIRPEHAVELYRLIPHAQLAILPGTDHMSVVNRTDYLLVMIPRFLDQPLAE
jgi:pimeloyl-ACP methyl ester carboxylesterase